MNGLTPAYIKGNVQYYELSQNQITLMREILRWYRANGDGTFDIAEGIMINLLYDEDDILKHPTYSEVQSPIMNALRKEYIKKCLRKKYENI